MTTIVYRRAAPVLALILFTAGPALADFDTKTAAAVDAAITGEHRSSEDKARDKYRRPRETLEFFGFRSDMTVLEIWPGGGWYTKVLAAALKDEGKLYAAHYNVNGPFGFQRDTLGTFFFHPCRNARDLPQGNGHLHGFAISAGRCALCNRRHGLDLP